MLEVKFKAKCPVCRGNMKYKMFVGTGNMQGWECVPCGLLTRNETLRKLDEAMFSWRVRNKCQQV